MAELADALDSKSSSRKGVRVRPPLRVPKNPGMEKVILEVRQRSSVIVVLWVVLGIWLVLWAAGWRSVLSASDPVSPIMFNFFMGTVALSLLWYPVSRAYRMNTLALS